MAGFISNTEFSGQYAGGRLGFDVLVGMGFTLIKVAILALASLVTGCSPEAANGFVPPADLTPPIALRANADSECSFLIEFSESVVPVAGSFGFTPSLGEVSTQVEGERLGVLSSRSAEAGRTYSVAGEVQDAHGNATRFVFAFIGYNARPVILALSELQTGKNSSKSAPHRDYIELVALRDGNLAGCEVSWASSVKEYRYVFPPAEIKKGDYVVLHCAPEGLPGEVDETGQDLDLAVGVDATASGRDFWCADGGLPDSSGAVAIRQQAGSGVSDCVFYATEDREGAMKEDRLSAFLTEDSGAWEISEPPRWEDAYRRKSSSARSMARSRDALAAMMLSGSGENAGSTGPGSWYLCDSGAQSPGAINAEAGSVAASRKARTVKGG